MQEELKEQGLEVGTLTHNIGDCHIYDRHIPLIKKLIDAEPVECSPKLVINNPTKDFYEFKVEDFEIKDYDYNKEISATDLTTVEIQYDTSSLDTKTPGEYKIKAIATDTSGNKTEKEITVHVTKKPEPKKEEQTASNQTVSYHGGGKVVCIDA